MNGRSFKPAAPALKLDGEPVRRGSPIPNRHDPFLADVVQREVKQFADAFIGRKGAAGPGDVSWKHVNRFNRGRGVNQLP